MDESQIIQTGKLLGADAMIVGSIVPRTAVWRNLYTNQVYNSTDGVSNAQIKIIDVETGASIGAVSFDNGKTFIVFKGLQSTAEIIGKEIVDSLKPTQ